MAFIPSVLVDTIPIVTDINECQNNNGGLSH